MAPRLIVCFGGGNDRLARLVRSCGWETGARADHGCQSSARPLTLLDVHWTDYDWPAYLRVAAAECPEMAVVPDVERSEDVPRALGQAEELARHCGTLIVVPKDHGVCGQVPGVVAGRPVVLGYSVPTRYGGTEVGLWEFGRRPVHLLGGTPHAQREVSRYLNAVSLDGNVAWRLARRGAFYRRCGGTSRSIKVEDGRPWPDDEGLPYEAMRRSLINLREFWGGRVGGGRQGERDVPLEGREGGVRG